MVWYFLPNSATLALTSGRFLTTACYSSSLVGTTNQLFSHYRTSTSIMGNWGSKPLKEVLRENKRVITRAIRELDREKAGLEREEKRLTIEIKKAARENQMNSVKVMAKVSRTSVVALSLFVISVCLAYRLTAPVPGVVRLTLRNPPCRTWYEHDNTLPNSLKCEVTCRV